MRQYRIKTREHRLVKQRERRLATKKHCPNCNNLMGSEAKQCRVCYYKSMIGQRSNAWKGGIHRHSQGYIMLHKPQHPRASKQGYVLEHILIWEQSHDQPLPKGWHIHHLNAIKDDNRPINLLALSAFKHSMILSAMSKRIQVLEARLRNQGHLL